MKMQFNHANDSDENNNQKKECLPKRTLIILICSISLIVIISIILGVVLGTKKSKSEDLKEEEPPSISPLSFGLNEAKNGTDRYYILLKTHQEAKKNETGVNYCGISYIDIEIPNNFTSIPLTDYTNFCGVTLHVLNNYAGKVLFTQSLTPKNLDITGQEIDALNISEKEELQNGTFLIYIEDKNPWVENRAGYSYGHTRKDILIVNDGKISNKAVASYATNASSPLTKYISVSNKQKIFKNLNFERDVKSTKITSLVSFNYQYNIHLSNIKVTTPNNDELYGDTCIQLLNCAQIKMDDITINGTYSLKNKYGYGLSLNNIYDLQVTNMWGHGQWGIFGTNNINKASIKDSNLNRFDIHCYGRDIESINTAYSNVYNQFSSVYGYVSFTDCSFNNSIPVLFEYSYNAYTFFNLNFKNCKFFVNSNKNYIISAYDALNMSKINSRPELMDKYLPDIKFDNFQFIVPAGIKIVRVYKFSYSPQKEVKVDLSGINIISEQNVSLQISN